MLSRKFQYYIHRILEEFQCRISTFRGLLKMRYWGIFVEKGFRLNGKINVINMNQIKISENVRINSGYVNFVGGEMKTSFYTGQNGRIVIGENVGISNSVFVSQNSIVIEKNVFIGGGCRFYDNDFHSVFFEERISAHSSSPSAPIRVCEGAFVGGHCIVLKGVEIGSFSVVGAGSVVTKSIPSKELWAGVPAKKIKSLY